MEDLSELGVMLPIKIKKERTELQKVNDEKTRQRMKVWHKKRREEKDKRKLVLEEVIKEEISDNTPDDEKIIVKIYDNSEKIESVLEPQSMVQKLISKIEKKVKKPEGEPIIVIKNAEISFDN